MAIERGSNSGFNQDELGSTVFAMKFATLLCATLTGGCAMGPQGPLRSNHATHWPPRMQFAVRIPPAEPGLGLLQAVAGRSAIWTGGGVP